MLGRRRKLAAGCVALSIKVRNFFAVKRRRETQGFRYFLFFLILFSVLFF